MSSAQGPREAGMQASANTAGRRRHGVLVWFGLTEAAGMSRMWGCNRGECRRPPTPGAVILFRTLRGGRT
jgi:hypothetical protein